MLNCPECGAWANVLQTRDNKANDMVRRRYECINLHRYTTIEQIVGGVIDAADVFGGRPRVYAGDPGDVDSGRRVNHE